MLAGVQPLEGIAQADAHLGRLVPLPHIELPLARWVDVSAVGDGAVEVCWNLDDTRDDRPGRLALYAGAAPPPERELDDATEPLAVAAGLLHREAPLAQAQPSLRPVHELTWTNAGLFLRLTGQGPWAIAELVAIAQSIS
jgi:hypothetical protein